MSKHTKQSHLQTARTFQGFWWNGKTRYAVFIITEELMVYVKTVDDKGNPKGDTLKGDVHEVLEGFRKEGSGRTVEECLKLIG